MVVQGQISSLLGSRCVGCAVFLSDWWLVRLSCILAAAETSVTEPTFAIIAIFPNGLKTNLENWKTFNECCQTLGLRSAPITVFGSSTASRGDEAQSSRACSLGGVEVHRATRQSKRRRDSCDQGHGDRASSQRRNQP